MFKMYLLKIIKTANKIAKLAKNESKIPPIISLSAKENSCALLATMSIGLNKNIIKEKTNETKALISTFSLVVYLFIFALFFAIFLSDIQVSPI